LDNIDATQREFEGRNSDPVKDPSGPTVSGNISYEGKGESSRDLPQFLRIPPTTIVRWPTKDKYQFRKTNTSLLRKKRNLQAARPAGIPQQREEISLVPDRKFHGPPALGVGGKVKN